MPRDNVSFEGVDLPGAMEQGAICSAKGPRQVWSQNGHGNRRVINIGVYR